MIGCTSDMFQCYQVRVQYIDQDYKNNTAIDEFHESTWKNLSRYDNLENEVCSSTKNYPSTFEIIFLFLSFKDSN